MIISYCYNHAIITERSIFMLIRNFSTYRQINPHELSTKQLNDLEKEIKHLGKDLMSDQLLDFLLWSKGLPSRQESFANFVLKKLAKTSYKKILEVGGGRTARLSRIIAKAGYEVTCIDTIIEKEFKSDNLTLIKDMFDYKTFDLSDYDFIIAQEPCDATEHVLLACKAQNKPFYMSLCGVPHKKLSGETPKSCDDWYNYLLKESEGYVKLIWLSLDPLSRTAILKSKTGF